MSSRFSGPTVNGRAPELYGRRAKSVLGRNIFGPALSNRRAALWVGEMDQPLGPMFIGDFAFGLAALALHENSLGGLAHPD